MTEEDQGSCWSLDQLDMPAEFRERWTYDKLKPLAFLRSSLLPCRPLSQKQESTQPWHHETVNTVVYISICMCERLSSLPKQMSKMLKRLSAQLLANKLMLCFIPLSVLVWIPVMRVTFWLHGHHYLKCSYMYTCSCLPTPHRNHLMLKAKFRRSKF